MAISTRTALSRNVRYYGSLLICSVCLLIPAIWNHYPLVNPDTATYIESGFLPDSPADRPITYGILVRLLTLNGLSLWLMVFAQAYLVSWLVFSIFKNITSGRSY